MLPEAHQKVIRDLQPTYFVEGLGHMDVPINETALQIRDVSNANKHRNLTPALRTTQSLGFAYPTGTEPAPSLEMVFEREETPLGPFNDDVILELRWPRGTLSDDYVRGIRPATTLRLAAHGSGFMYPRLSTELPIYVVDFARRVPAYVRHALTVLEQAELHDGRPIGAFRPDFDLTL